MIEKQLINYASALAVHPLIAEHPLYKSMLSSDMEKFCFEHNNFSLPLTVVPTYYKQLRTPHCIVIEDYITLFFPHLHNGSNFEFDYKTSHLTAPYKRAFEDEKFRGVICHMRQTLDSIAQMFGQSEIINKKLHYLPLAYESHINKIKPTNPERVVLTFTNSFGGEKNNFPLRGGLEALTVYKDLYEAGHRHLFLKLIGALNMDPELLKWFKECENVTIYDANTTVHQRPMVTDDIIHDVLLDTDIFLIPACRIHSMSVVRALCYGNIVLGSNGWGFDEFLDSQFCCEGQEKSSYVEDGVLKEKYSLFLEQPNQRLYDSIKQKLIKLINDPSQMDDIKKINLEQSRHKFSKTSRDKMLETIIDKML